MTHIEKPDPKAKAIRTQSSQMRVMVVDDEPEIANLVASLLEPEGIDATAFTNPKAALDAFPEEAFDMAILDIMMPGMDGFELCSRLRAISDIPILFLSARDEETDQVVGFTIGADDYVTKPFKPRELVARVRAHLRRAKRKDTPVSESILEVGDITVNLVEHKASLHGENLGLTPKEFSILALLAKHAGQPVSAADIYRHVWNDSYDISATNTVMVHIRHLRHKLSQIDSSVEFIETVWGVGYRIPKAKGLKE